MREFEHYVDVQQKPCSITFEYMCCSVVFFGHNTIRISLQANLSHLHERARARAYVCVCVWLVHLCDLARMIPIESVFLAISFVGCVGLVLFALRPNRGRIININKQHHCGHHHHINMDTSRARAPC